MNANEQIKQIVERLRGSYERSEKAAEEYKETGTYWRIKAGYLQQDINYANGKLEKIIKDDK